MAEIDLNKYKEFVDAVTSDESSKNDDFSSHWAQLNNTNRDINMPRLLRCSWRYPGGEFDAHYSENRVKGDL